MKIAAGLIVAIFAVVFVIFFIYQLKEWVYIRGMKKAGRWLPWNCVCRKLEAGKSTPHNFGDAVVITSCLNINDLIASDSHGPALRQNSLIRKSVGDET